MSTGKWSEPHVSCMTSQFAWLASLCELIDKSIVELVLCVMLYLVLSPVFR